MTFPTYIVIYIIAFSNKLICFLMYNFLNFLFTSVLKYFGFFSCPKKNKKTYFNNNLNSFPYTLFSISFIFIFIYFINCTNALLCSFNMDSFDRILIINSLMISYLELISLYLLYNLSIDTRLLKRFKKKLITYY
ncbi:hypothetical protein BNATCHR1104 (nucleomorph) [Bigelowiella natans]|uniref:Uncharacterized protein n=1 Tax=Bigelowiella natans TaxID=227086 RepID=Q3LWH3_BIGNA|nr:hypothetical protein BNATCHR1104 [Bigelowiella natans]ABA27193.1 hypothetical protein [Bigelowiella natans]